MFLVEIYEKYPVTLQPIQPDIDAENGRSGRRIAVLGATGSIGKATIDVIEKLHRNDPSSNWDLGNLSAHRRVDELFALAAAPNNPGQPSTPRIVVSDSSMGDQAKHLLRRNGWEKQCRLDIGPEALVEAAVDPEVDTVVAAIVGRAGLESTLAAVKAGKRVGLANKETLVVAGPVVMKAAQETGSELLPIDSEHSAIFQCLSEARALADARAVAGPRSLAKTRESAGAPTGEGADKADARKTFQQRMPGVRRLILTASGGPFRDWTTEQMTSATREQALNHPTWEMGEKITIDSATMMNKALEVIEACWLFDVPADRIEVVIHPQSLIHSLVEFDDSSVVAQISPPDMRLPIQYALTYPNRLPCPAPELSRQKPWEMSLLPADLERFPALSLGFEVAAAGGTAGAVVNGANEAAVALFLAGKIRFTDIARLCRQALHDHNHEATPELSRLLELETWARDQVEKRANSLLDH